MQTIEIVPITKSHCDAFAHILSTDTLLKKEGIAPDKPISPHEVFQYFCEWSEKNAAQCYAIIAENKVIGSISLSHINHEEKTARIGYWIGSAFRKKGYASVAFQKILTDARHIGIEIVSADIATENLPSLALWQKYGAQFSEKKPMTHVTLDISRVTF